MTDAAPTTTLREAVGVFHHWNNLSAAVDELLNHGFDRSDISLLAGEKVVTDKLGHVYNKVSELEDDPNAPRVAYSAGDAVTEGKTAAIGALGYIGALAAVGAIVASGGTLAAAALGAAAAGGGGAVLGGLLSRLIGRDRARNIEAQLEKGGLLLWVRTRTPECEQKAIDTLKRHGGEDVHVHEIVTDLTPARDPLDGRTPDPFLPGARI